MCQSLAFVALIDYIVFVGQKLTTDANLLIFIMLPWPLLLFDVQRKIQIPIILRHSGNRLRLPNNFLRS